VCKGTEWRSTDGCMFREKAIWFVSVAPLVHLDAEVTEVAIQIKPMATDPLFWEIVGLPENKNAPLSFRLNGVWTCRAPDLNKIAVREEQQVTVTAGTILRVADVALARIVNSFSLEQFLGVCEERNKKVDRYQSSLVTTLLAMDREHEALMQCEKAQQRGLSGGFQGPDGTFNDMAAKWIKSSLSRATKH
jgi:hypothetical protein